MFEALHVKVRLVAKHDAELLYKHLKDGIEPVE
jgi:hypothetical protein